MTRASATILTLLTLCAGSVSAQERRELRGVVVDTASVPLADVELLASTVRSRSSQLGEFRLIGVARGKVVVVARKPGFAPESLTVMQDSERVRGLRIVLRRVADLDEITVREAGPISARHMGFEDRRRRRNGGQFITRDDIEKRGPIVTADLLRRLQGIRMVDSQGVTLAVSSRAPKVNLMSRQTVVNCVLRVGVDGSVKESGFPVNAIPTKEIYGIEVYSGAAQLPTEFNSARRDAYCGLIMVWTRTQ